MKRAIISGADGFIGRALTKELSSNSIPVTALVRDKNVDACHIDKLPHVSIVYCDMADVGRLPLVPGRAEQETVFYHLAWQGTSGIERTDYSLQLKNVGYTVEALKAAVQMGCEGFVGAGSLMEYESTEAVYNTNQTPGLANIYSTAKLTAHYISRIIAANSNIRFVWPYITNAYSENEVSPRFLNTTVKKMLSGERLEFSYN